MKYNKWTVGLAAVGLVSLASAVKADEQQNYLQTALSSTTISGYVDTSIEYTAWKEISPVGAGAEVSPPIAFRGGKNDGFNLNVIQLNLEKPLDESEWASGYKVQLLVGPDAVGYNASPGGGGDLGIKQAYVNLRTPVGNGIEWKIGVFDTIIGYEVFEAGNNPNFTRSYGYAIEPTQHTGILAAYRVNDIVSLQAGVANTSAAGINARDNDDHDSAWSKTWMGSIALTAPECWGWAAGSTFYAGIVYGYNGGADGNPVIGGNWNNGNQANYYAGLTLNTGISGLKFGAAWDHVNNIAGGTYTPAPGAGFFNNYITGDTVALYASYQATPKLSLHGRFDWGAFQLRNGALGHASVSGVGVTGTLQYDLWQNVLSRLEIRWDNVTDKDIYNDAGATLGFTERSFVSLYANIIYKF